MKKLFLCILLAFFALVVHAQDLQVLDNSGTLRKAGGFEVKQRHKGILPQIIWEGKTAVSVTTNTVLEPPFDVLETRFAAQTVQTEDLVYDYFKQAWNFWREAANAYLPARYKLPRLSFFRNGKEPKGFAGKTVPVFLTARFPAVASNRLGVYVVHTDQIELTLPIHLLSFLASFGEAPERKEEVMQEYKSVVCNITAENSLYWQEVFLQGDEVRWIRGVGVPSAEEIFCLRDLAAIPPEELHKRGPLAMDNQSVMTHEMGHMLGFGHMDGSVMSTGKLRNNRQVKPTEQDGLRLATLVCWHHNQLAEKEVCIPQVKSPAPPEKNPNK